MTTSHPKSNMEGSLSHTHHKIAIPSIETIAQMWYRYPIHEAMAIQQGKPILKEILSNEELLYLGTPLTKIEEFRILCEHSQRYINIFTHMRGRMRSWDTTFVSHNFQNMKSSINVLGYLKASTSLFSLTTDSKT